MKVTQVKYSPKRMKAIKHYRSMLMEVWNRNNVNHRDYGKNDHYFKMQAEKAQEIINS